jgi:hypothetical protein
MEPGSALRKLNRHDQKSQKSQNEDSNLKANLVVPPPTFDHSVVFGYDDFRGLTDVRDLYVP